MTDFQAYIASVTIVCVFALSVLGVTLRELVRRITPYRERDQ